MAIQNRRGVYSDFTPSKMVPGELAVVQSGDPNNTSGKAVYAAFGASGDVKRLASEDDLSGKVDKVTGKGLSTNDYTTAEKNKLAGIATGAEVNVQSDWNQTTTTADDFIKNKPTKTSDFTNDGDGESDFATEAYVQENGGKIDTISVNGTQQTITNKNVDIPVPVIDNTLTQTGEAADAKVVGDELASVKSDLHYGNLNQKISVNPFVIRTTSDRYGTIRPNRSTVTINQDGTLKITPESSTNTTAGFFTEINNDSSSDRKIYISVSDLTTTRSDFSKWRMFISQNGTMIEGTRLEFTESNYYSIVYDLTGLSADYAIQVNLLEVGTENNSNTTYFTVGSMQYIDLTEIFGAGYEPSISEFEQIYKSDMPYNKHIPTVTSELKEEKLFRLNCINDINDIRKQTEKTFMFDSELWSSITLISSSGNLAPTDSERSLLTIPIPKFITSIVCPSVSSVLFARRNGEYIGVWNGSAFAKVFASFSELDMFSLFRAYPDYDFYVVVYAYPESVNNAITFKASSWGSLPDTYAKSTVNTLNHYIEGFYNVAQSLDENLGYAPNTGLYAEEVSSDGVNRIQCSELVYAALRKTEYINSRYVKSKNTENPCYWETDGSVADIDYKPRPYILDDYLRADQLAKYFDAKGKLIKFDSAHTDIRPGDLFFQGYSESDNYKNITHVAVVATYQRYQNQIIVFDGSTGEKPDGTESGVNMSLFTPNSYTYYTHLDIVPDTNKSRLIASTKIASVAIPPGATTSSYIVTLVGGKSLKGFYTVFVSADNVSDIVFNVSHVAYHDGTTSTSRIVYGSGINEVIPIGVPECNDRRNYLDVRARNTSDTTISVENIKIEVYEGIHDSVPTT